MYNFSAGAEGAGGSRFLELSLMFLPFPPYVSSVRPVYLSKDYYSEQIRPLM